MLELAAAKIWRMRRQHFDAAGGDLLLEAARSQAAVVWEALRRLSHDDRRFLLDHTPGYAPGRRWSAWRTRASGRRRAT